MPQQGTATKSRTMGIRKRHRASGTRYEARWYEADGTERARTFRTEDEAQAQLDEVRHGKRRGTYVSPALQRTPFGQTAEEWLAAKERKPRTVKVYRHMFDTWLKPWMDRPVGSIGYSDVTALVAEMRTAGAQRRRSTTCSTWCTASSATRWTRATWPRTPPPACAATCQPATTVRSAAH